LEIKKVVTQRWNHSKTASENKKPQPTNQALLPIRGEPALLLPLLSPLLENGLALLVVPRTTLTDQLVSSENAELLEEVLLEILMRNGNALDAATKTSLPRESVAVVLCKEERESLKTQTMVIGIASLVDMRIDQPLNIATDLVVK
jgi:hypothetical protein